MLNLKSIILASLLLYAMQGISFSSTGIWIESAWTLPDEDPESAGTQTYVLPGGTKDASIHALACSESGAGDIEETWVKIDLRGSHLNLMLPKEETGAEEKLTEAIQANLAKPGDLELFNNGTCALYRVSFQIGYTVSPGTYNASLHAASVNGSASPEFPAVFEILPVTALQLDFKLLDFREVKPGRESLILGDYVMENLSPGTSPTLQNIGNTPLKLTISADPMESDCGGNGASIIPPEAIRAIIGSNVKTLSGTMDEFGEVTLHSGAVERVDFTLKPRTGSCIGRYAGLVYLAAREVDITPAPTSSTSTSTTSTSTSSSTSTETSTTSTKAPTTTHRPLPPVGTIFVSGKKLTANMGGLGGADAKCMEIAAESGLGGIWKALLSTLSINASDRIPDATYLTMNGTLVALNKTDLFDGSIDSAIDLTENLTLVSGGIVWTGSGTNGAYSGNSCSDWTTNSPSETGSTGYVDQGRSWMAESHATACASGARIYCVLSAISMPASTTSTSTSTTTSSTTSTTIENSVLITGHVYVNGCHQSIPYANVSATCLANDETRSSRSDANGSYAISLNCIPHSLVEINASSGPVSSFSGNESCIFEGGFGTNIGNISTGDFKVINVYLTEVKKLPEIAPLAALLIILVTPLYAYLAAKRSRQVL